MAMSRQVGPGLKRAVGSGWDPTEMAHHTRLSDRRLPGPDARGLGGEVPVLIGAVVVLTAVGLAARYAPDLLVSLLVVGAVVALPVLGARGSRAWGLGRERGRAGEAGLTPTHSEAELVQWVAGLLGSFQYQIQRSEPASQHAGSDIELVGRDPDGRLIMIRCLSNAPGDQVGFLVMLRLMAAVIQARGEGGILVTTTSFTRAAITLAGYSPVPVALYDGSALARPEWAGTAA